MDNKDNIYGAAKIFFEGDVGRELIGGPVAVYRMELDNTNIWFVASNNYASNGNDFTVVLSKFGLGSKSVAANSGSIWQREFDRKSAKYIQSRLSSFFIGNEEKPFFPYNLHRGKCLSVVFSEGWITFKKEDVK